MLIEIKTKESTEYIEVDRVEDAKDTVYYDRNGINNSISKDDCEQIVLHQSSRILKVIK